jgi:hypothetical protein
MAKSGFEKFTMKTGGARALLRSDEVRRDLDRRARNVAEVAQAQHPPDFEVRADSYVGAGRAGATVVGLLRLERTNRVLGGAIDAART